MKTKSRGIQKRYSCPPHRKTGSAHSSELEDFAEKLTRVLPFFIREFTRRQSIELYKGKITVQQFVALSFLSYISTDKGATMSEIAKSLHVTMPAATGVVDRLIRDSYCLRGTDPVDRRVIRVKITPGGDRIVKKIYIHRKEMIIRIFGKLTKHDRDEYLRIFTRVGEILKV